jgi:DNA (cytosine-5)-methyltransferase 1
VFVIASAADGFDPGEILFEWEGVRRDSPPSREPQQGAAEPVEAGADIGGQEIDDGVRITNRLIRQPLAFGGNNTSGQIHISPALTAHGGASGRLDFETEAFLVQLPVAFGAKDGGQDAAVDLSPTLRAGAAVDSSANGGAMPAVAYEGSPEAFTVRRFMPLECERVQGFPDNWTRIPVRFYRDKKVTKNRPEDLWEAGVDRNGTAGWWLMQADGPRYKQMGNSMATRCMAWIGARIQRWRSLEPFRELIG